MSMQLLSKRLNLHSSPCMQFNGEEHVLLKEEDVIGVMPRRCAGGLQYCASVRPAQRRSRSRRRLIPSTLGTHAGPPSTFPSALPPRLPGNAAMHRQATSPSCGPQATVC